MARSEERTNGRRRGARRSAAKERFWRGHVARQQRIDESVRAYCRKHELSEPSFYAWRAELARRNAGEGHAQRRPAPRSPSQRRRVARRPATFLPVTVDGLAAPQIEVQLKSGLVIRIPASDQAALRAVLEAVEGRAC
jgi:hypothetical protein